MCQVLESKIQSADIAPDFGFVETLELGNIMGDNFTSNNEESNKK